MKYKHRQDREIRRRMRLATPYESRKKIRGRQHVSNVVDKFSNTLDGFGSAKEAAYTPKFTDTPKNLVELLDKYYRPYHTLSMDLITEQFGGETKKASVVPLAIMLLMFLLLSKF